MDTNTYDGRRFVRLNAPMERNGKRLSFEEVFRSAFHEPTIEIAQKDLEAIRYNHDEKHGWYEIDAWIECYDGKFVAVRYHARYK